MFLEFDCWNKICSIRTGYAIVRREGDGAPGDREAGSADPTSRHPLSVGVVVHASADDRRRRQQVQRRGTNVRRPAERGADSRRRFRDPDCGRRRRGRGVDRLAVWHAALEDQGLRHGRGGRRRRPPADEFDVVCRLDDAARPSTGRRSAVVVGDQLGAGP